MPAGPTRFDAFTASGVVPLVTLDQITSPSNNTTPSFSGTASATTPVTVAVYRGGSAGGTPAATVKAQGTGGAWASPDVSPAFADGTYTAVATQPGSMGGDAGASNSMTFEINTKPPTVALNAPPSPSNDTTPSFTGTASDETRVTVEIFEGTKPEGDIVATAVAPGTRAGWTAGEVTPALPGGRHTFTAFASQPSGIHNGPGKSAPVTFVVDTEPPTVTLEGPPSPSNETTPSFSGTASDNTQITVEIFEGPQPEGKVLATATATGTPGSWTSGHATPALGNGTFTALATQTSAIGNPAGNSQPVTFIVDTSPPTVTLNPPLSPTANAAPSFSGTASDHTAVTIDVYSGAAGQGPIVASATAESYNGQWVSDRASPALQWGEYTAVASQPSSIGNPGGTSAPVAFSVQPIAPTVETEAASGVTRTAAELYGGVDPHGAGVSGCYFEYGATASYGTSIECGFVSEIEDFPPSGTAVVPVFARIYGLSPGTTYHFRIVSVGEGGTGTGADATFTTQPPWIFNAEGSPGATPLAPSGPTKPSGVTARRVAALIAAQLTPRGRNARIAALLRGGVFRAQFKAPEAGTALIAWYPLSPGAQRTGGTAPSPLPVASGRLRFRAGGTAGLNIHLTGVGWRLLSHSRRIRLTATCAFTPTGATPIRASATFELKR